MHNIYVTPISWNASCTETHRRTQASWVWVKRIMYADIDG